MRPEHEELWSRITAFQFDDGACALPFTRRLARENGWTEHHARRVVETVINVPPLQVLGPRGVGAPYWTEFATFFKSRRLKCG